jgi:hypothetical protein
MNTVSISPGQLFKDSLNAVGSIYGPLLLINSPILVFIPLNSFLQSRPLLLDSFYLLSFFVLVPLLTGATIYMLVCGTAIADSRLRVAEND